MDNMQEESEITLSHLAEIMQSGFLSMEKRLASIESGLSEIRTNANSTYLGLDEKANKTDLLSLEVRMEKLETEAEKETEEVENLRDKVRHPYKAKISRTNT